MCVYVQQRGSKERVCACVCMQVCAYMCVSICVRVSVRMCMCTWEKAVIYLIRRGDIVLIDIMIDCDVMIDVSSID